MQGDYRGDYNDSPAHNPGGGHQGGGRGGYGGGYGGRGRGGHGGGGGRGSERRGIPLSELDPTLTEFSRRVIGCSIEVHKALGPGFDKSTYLAALKAEMDANGLNYAAGHAFPVSYKDKNVGSASCDLYVENRFVVEVLARPGEVSTFDRLGVRAKLKAGSLDLGLVINFAERRLKDGLVRVLNIDKLNAERGIGGGEGHESDVPSETGGGGGHEFETR